MADTGTSENMAVDTEGVDLEIATLISAVVDRSLPRRDALSKRVKRTGPQLRRVSTSEADSARSEINSLMDDIRRDADARAAAETVEIDEPAAKPAEWIEDAVMAAQTMQRHDELSGETQFAEPEQEPKKRSFASNPFKQKAAVAVAGAAALPVIGALVSDDEDEALVEAVEVEAVETEERDAEPADDYDAIMLADADQVDEAYIADDLDTDEDAAYAAALIDEDQIAVETEPMVAVSAAAMDAQDYHEDDGKLPVWLAMGIPVAAVSMAALVAGVNVVRENGAEVTPIEAASLAPLVTTYADASAGADPIAPLPAEEVILASAPVSAPEAGSDAIANISLDTPDLDTPDLDAAVIVPDAAPEIVNVVAPVATLPETTLPEPAVRSTPQPVQPRSVEPARTILASSAIPSLPSSKPAIQRVSASPTQSFATISPGSASSAPARASRNNIPSLKPQLASARRSVNRTTSTVRNIASPAVFQPKSQVPVRMFDGYYERGSAALIVNTVAADMGSTLSKTEQSWLARDMERVLDNEIDGRDVSLKSERGDRISVMFWQSGQELRRLPVSRERGVAPLPKQMVLEGGWYAARSDVSLRATPSQAGAFNNRMISKDTLIERIATVTDRYGDRWYLMGRDGVAVGYMSPADLILAGAVGETVGLPYNRRHGEVVSELLEVYTRCRSVFVGPHGSTRQKMDVCRNAKGNWVGASAGVVPVQQANARPEPIVLASAVGQSAELAPFEAAAVQKQLTPKLVYGRAGQVVKQKLADGRDVELTLGEKYQATRIVPVMRLEALGRIEKPVRLDARWMRVPGGARLRATPDYLTTMTVGAIPAGQTIETIGAVEGDHGEDWVLVGRNGVGFGYVQRQELMPLAGSTALRAVPSQHTAAVVDLVESVTDCRSVAYTGDGLDGTFTACQQPNGAWAFTADAELRQLVEVVPTTQVAP
ncbi:MAG: hypothetical protein ABJG15_08300 [Hyphomonadaceae bacterium]